MHRVNRHFLTDAAIYGIGGVAIQLASVVLLPLYTYYLAPSDYGVMEVIERIGQIINICLMTNGVRQATFAFYLQAADQADRERVAVTITAFLVAIFSLAGLTILTLSPILAPLLGIANPWLLVFGVVTVLAELFLVIPLTLMQARVESLAFVTVSLLMLIVRVGLAVVFVAVMGWGVWGVYGSLLISFVTFGAVLTGRELKRGPMTIDWNKCREIVRFSLPFVPTGICYVIYYNSDRFFLVRTAGTAALGVYALGCKIAAVAGIITWQPLFKVWSARMYETFAKPDAARVAGRMLTRMLTVYALVATGLCLFHREALRLLSSAAYAGAGSVIAPILLAGGCMFAATFMEGVFYVWRKTYLKPRMAVVSMTIILGLYAVLVPRYSILGAAYGTMLGYAAMALVTYVVAQRVFAVDYEWRKVFVLVGLSSAANYGGSLLELGTGPFLLKCLLMLAWLTAICLTGVVSREERLVVQPLVRTAIDRLQGFRGYRKPLGEPPVAGAADPPSCPGCVP
ncbi:MAG: oligosaccharide flippase family protein [Thermoguttaceae bacterium]|jgi:O-antigen/teichoic acid export membrane protein